MFYLQACWLRCNSDYLILWFAEKAREFLQKTGRFIVIGGIISPVHDSYGKPVSEKKNQEKGSVGFYTDYWIIRLKMIH